MSEIRDERYLEGCVILRVFISQFLPPSPVNPVADAVSIVAALVVLSIQIGGEA